MKSDKIQSGNKHYDVAFLGNSLATLLAATLLAKKGCRALIIHNDRELPVSWLTSSVLLEKILDLLDGRACYSKPRPFQVITRNQRIDFHGNSPLVDELRRELPNEYNEVATFFEDLKALGEQLEDVLWDHHGLPTTGLGNRLKFRKNCFRADIPGRVFRQTLRERIAGFSEPGSRKLLSALFCGFSFTPANKLTLAECALIWSSLGRQGGISKSGLEELLWHRYRQFHGNEEELHRLARVRTGKDGSGKFLFDDEKVITADHIVFAERDTIALCEGAVGPPAGRLTRRLVSGNIHSRVSPLLSQQVIVDGKPPLRLAFATRESSTICQIENAAIGDRGLSSTEQVEQRLEKILPFVDLDLSPEPKDYSNVDIHSDERSSLVTAHDRIVFDHGRKLLCSGNAVIPELGASGEVLVAMTVTNRLLQTFGKPAL